MTLRLNHDRDPDLLIGCVDPRAARGVIDRSVCEKSSYVAYWLDLGNNASSGQFVLGQPPNGRNRRKAERLRTVSELYPEIADAGASETTCRVAPQLRRSNGRSRLSIRRSRRAPWPCWRDFSVTAGFGIMADSLTPKLAR